MALEEPPPLLARSKWSADQVVLGSNPSMVLRGRNFNVSMALPSELFSNFTLVAFLFLAADCIKASVLTNHHSKTEAQVARSLNTYSCSSLRLSQY